MALLTFLIGRLRLRQSRPQDLTVTAQEWLSEAQVENRNGIWRGQIGSKGERMATQDTQLSKHTRVHLRKAWFTMSSIMRWPPDVSVQVCLCTGCRKNHSPTILCKLNSIMVSIISFSFYREGSQGGKNGYHILHLLVASGLNIRMLWDILQYSTFVNIPSLRLLAISR
jgi:hypothetical protein